MLFKPLLIVGVAVCGAHYWHDARHASGAVTGGADENGFVYMPPIEGQKANTVYVVVGPNGSSGDEWRAARLVDELGGKGIPVVITSRVTFVPIGFAGVDDSGVDKVTTFMSGPSPIVFVDGKAKADATAEEVQAEFTRGTAPLLSATFSWK
jgi:hypothetical protein